MPLPACLTARSRVTPQRSLALLSSSSCPMHCRVPAAAAATMRSERGAATWLLTLQPHGVRQVKLLEGK